jgi:signal transduction histidine kinase
MKSITHMSLAKKLTASAISILAVCIILITAITYATIVYFGDDFLENELVEKSEFINKAFVAPIWTFDQYQVEEIANSLLTHSKYTYINALRIENMNGEVIFEKGQNPNVTFHLATKLPYTRTKEIEIAKDGSQIGKVYVAMTNEGYIKSFRQQFILITVVSVVLLFILALVVNYYFNKTLTVPMSKILEHVHQIEKENYAQHEIGHLPYEMESISKALNQAASVIEKRNNDIMYYANDLETLVSERTSALEEQMSKNLTTARLAAVGELAADVAHEVNNPLMVIDLHAAKLKRLEKEFELPPSLIHSVEKIQAMIKRIGKIIKGLKAISRDGNADPMVAFPINSIIEDTKMLVEMKLKTHGIHFEVMVENPEVEVIGREVQISQVLVNLIGNSVDAICDLKDKWICLEVRESEDEVIFLVTDCGNGIPESVQGKIMHPFFTTKEASKGTGLGLSISKNIIEGHGGTLIYNHQHEHTQFIFTLQKNKTHHANSYEGRLS